jgi:hypothetical protein
MDEAIKATLDKHNLTVESVFVPLSWSRNKGEKSPSLNWKVTLKQNGRDILTTDYSAGYAHAPSYKQGNFNTVDGRQAVIDECEKGFKVTGTFRFQDKKSPILPNDQDVIYSLLTDSEVLEYACFEDWAGEFGYDADSRKDEQIYNACLKIALQFRKIGESTIAELREAYQNY